MSEATRAAVERMKVAAEKARRESLARGASYRGMYCDGTEHGLLAAVRMLEEEHSKLGRIPGCAVCHLSEKLCKEFPRCRGLPAFSTSRADQKTCARARKARRRRV